MHEQEYTIINDFFKMTDEEDAQKAVQEETLTDYLKRRNLVPPTPARFGSILDLKLMIKIKSMCSVGCAERN